MLPPRISDVSLLHTLSPAKGKSSRSAQIDPTKSYRESAKATKIEETLKRIEYAQSSNPTKSPSSLHLRRSKPRVHHSTNPSSPLQLPTTSPSLHLPPPLTHHNSSVSARPVSDTDSDKAPTAPPAAVPAHTLVLRNHPPRSYQHLDTTTSSVPDLVRDAVVELACLVPCPCLVARLDRVDQDHYRGDRRIGRVVRRGRRVRV